MLIKSKVHRFIFVSNHLNPSNFQCIRTFLDNIEINFVPDRGLDHAVEKEKDLKYVVNLKNLLKSEPSKSLPLSSIVDHSEKLRIPCRTIDFIRKYPNFFEEYFPGNIAVHPHVRLTPESLNLDAEEQLMYDSDTFRKDAADRLLKLLMLCRINEFPLKLIDRFKWDLGLPDNYVDTLVPEFPDYFKVKRVNKTRPNRVEGLLELVCWSDELAVSAIEKMGKKGDPKYEKGMPIAFPLQFSNGFEMDKSLKRWLDDWQKLPYVSPYENATHLQPNTDMSDKWVVAVLHELLHTLVTKKTERENMLCLGEYLGIKPRLKRALAHHPGIFYRSSKIGTHTVVLRDGFKRGLLIDKHPLIDMRNKYIHLMHKVKEGKKPKSVANASKQHTVKEGEADKEEENEKETEEEMQLSGSDVEESSDDEEEDEEREVEGQVESSKDGGQSGRRRSDKIIEGRRKPEEVRVKSRRNALEEESDDDVEEEGQIESSGDECNDGRRGSGMANEGKGKPGECRGRRWRNVSWDESGEAREVNQAGSSRGGRNNGRRGSGRVNEGRRDPEEGRGRSLKNASHNESGGDDDDEERIESSRGGQNNGRRGPGKLNEGRRNPGEGKERPYRNASHNQSGGGDREERVESSRGGHSSERRGYGKVNEVRRKSGEGGKRPWSNASRNESGGGRHNEERIESSRGGGRGNGKRGFGEGRPWNKASRGESGSGGGYNEERVESSRGGRSNGRRGSGGGRPWSNGSRGEGERFGSSRGGQSNGRGGSGGGRPGRNASRERMA